MESGRGGIARRVVAQSGSERGLSSVPALKTPRGEVIVDVEGPLLAAMMASLRAEADEDARSGPPWACAAVATAGDSESARRLSVVEKTPRRRFGHSGADREDARRGVRRGSRRRRTRLDLRSNARGSTLERTATIGSPSFTGSV